MIDKIMTTTGKRQELYDSRKKLFYEMDGITGAIIKLQQIRYGMSVKIEELDKEIKRIEKDDRKT